MRLNRSKMLEKIQPNASWDIIIIGGGATGLGAAVDASSRGYKTLLLEMNDFASGTSSRSTKLVHGGVRYLEQGNLSLVLEALKEREILMRNAPHVVHRQSFVVPHYKWWKGIYYWIGLRLYDILAGRNGIGHSKHLSAQKTVDKVPNLKSEELRGSVEYFDGQFDDSRLAIDLAKTTTEQGGAVLNHMKVIELLKSNNKVHGVKAEDLLNNEIYEIRGKVVINATGVFSDSILKMDDTIHKSIIKPSQGIHIVVDNNFLADSTAVMIPDTKDGRVLFAIPWHDKVMIGTTDTPVGDISSEPKALDEEIDYLLEHVAEYLSQKPTRKDIRSVFAGLRPLIDTGKTGDTSEISRDHSLFVAPSDLITIAGGKWTTYRQMAEDAIDCAIKVGKLEKKDCITENLKIHGWDNKIDHNDPLSYYGNDKIQIQQIIKENPALGATLHERLPYLKAEVIWATRKEMAMTVEDFNARRTRALFIDAKASEEIAPEVARLMADEAGYDDDWIKAQVNSYRKLARSYQVTT